MTIADFRFPKARFDIGHHAGHRSRPAIHWSHLSTLRRAITGGENRGINLAEQRA